MRGVVLNIIGKTFKSLKVIAYLGANNKGKTLWLCQCVCGNYCQKDKTTLKGAKLGTCGCSRRRNEILTIKKTAYIRHKENAKARGIKSYLSFANYVDIASRKCNYCGDLSVRKNVSTGAVLKLNSVDRRNNELFYKISNSQSVCFICQFMKQELSSRQFIRHVRKIGEFYGKSRS